MNTNMTGFIWFSKGLRSCALEESNLSIGRVNVCSAPNCLTILGISLEQMEFSENI